MVRGDPVHGRSPDDHRHGHRQPPDQGHPRGGRPARRRGEPRRDGALGHDRRGIRHRISCPKRSLGQLRDRLHGHGPLHVERRCSGSARGLHVQPTECGGAPAGRAVHRHAHDRRQQVDHGHRRRAPEADRDAGDDGHRGAAPDARPRADLERRGVRATRTTCGRSTPRATRPPGTPGRSTSRARIGRPTCRPTTRSPRPITVTRS